MNAGSANTALDWSTRRVTRAAVRGGAACASFDSHRRHKHLVIGMPQRLSHFIAMFVIAMALAN